MVDSKIQDLHRLLRRQIKKHLPDKADFDEFVPFLEAVNKAYHSFDKDQAQLENTLELSSKELFRANEELRKNVESKTAETERLRIRIESIVNTVKDVVFQTDPEGRWIYLNPAWETNTGYTVTESIGRSFHEFIDPSQKEQSKAYLVHLLKEKLESIRYTIKYVSKSGERRWTEAFVNPSFDKNGNLLGFSGTLTDVTDRINAQRELKRLALVAEKTDNLVFISDSGGKIKWANRAFEEQSGYSLNEVVDKRATSLFHGPNTSRDTIFEMNTALSRGESFNGSVYYYNKSKRGIWLSVSITPIKNSKKSLEGFIAIGLDITEKKHHEQKLIESTNTLNFALEGNGYGLWDWHLPSGQVKFSDTWKTMLGHQPEEIKDDFDEWEVRLHPDDIDHAKKAIGDYLEGRSDQYKVDFRMRTKLGDYKWIMAMGKAVSLQADGTPLRIVGTHQDITERKEAEKRIADYATEMEKINGELDKFAYIVSHDLKAPLRAINNLSEWIEEDLGSTIDMGTKENMNLLRGRVKRMEGLINGILSYSRAGRVKRQTRAVDLNVLIKNILDVLPLKSNFKIDVNPKMPVIEGSDIEFEQIFGNYISNALKYNDAKHPTIDINYNINGRFYNFWVEDNGPGVEEDFQHKVFEIFQTLQPRDQVESTGVGLAIVKKIVEERGGKVWLESKPYEATRFYFSWPKAILESTVSN